MRRKKKKHSSVSLVSSVVCFFTIFRIFCTNPQCLDRLPAHWLPVLPSTGFVANLDGSKKKTVDPKQLQKSHFGIHFQFSLCWLEDKVGDKLGHKRRGRHSILGGRQEGRRHSIPDQLENEMEDKTGDRLGDQPREANTASQTRWMH